jgi:hypothetical protein
MKNEKTMLQWALAYAELGWHVFPLRTTGDLKRPAGFLGKADKDNPTGGHNKASADPAQIKRWWATSPNAGIGLNLAKSGLMAVDEDPRSGGDAELLALQARHGRLVTPIVARTGGGGRHFIYKAPSGARIPGKLAGSRGIDLKHNGYIVLAPSPHCAGNPPVPTGRNYAWVDGCDPFDDFPPILMPDWFMLSPSGGLVPQGKVDLEDVFAEDIQKAGVSLADIESMLALVSNDHEDDRSIDYDTWLAILAGIWHETDGSPEGEALALDWSRQSLKHTDEKFARTWPSLDHRGSGTPPTTIRLLIKLSNEAKKTEAAEAVAELKIALDDAPTGAKLREVCQKIKATAMDHYDRFMLRAQVQARHKKLTDVPLSVTEARKMTAYEDPQANELPDWLKPWRYLSKEDIFLKAGTTLTLTQKAFDNTFNRLMLTRQEKLEGISYPQETASHAALNRFEIPQADRQMYMPGEGERFTFSGETCFNTFNDRNQPPMPGKLDFLQRKAVRVLEDHFAFMVPNARERDLLVSWLAYLVQTQRRVNWSIVMQSLEGEGKTFFVELMGAVLGAENVQVLDSTIIKDRFTGWAAGSILKVVEEIKLHGMERFDILDKIKPFITNSTVSIRDLNKSAVNVINTASYLMFTNYRDALPVADGDSRYFMIASPRQTVRAINEFKESNPDYFSTLFGIINDAPGAIRQFFMEYPLSPDFSPTGRAPFSAEKAYVAAINKSENENSVEEMLELGDPAMSTRLFDITLMADTMIRNGDSPPEKKAMAYVMQKMGFTSLGRFKVEGRNHRYWSQEPHLFGTFQSKQAGKAIRVYLERPANLIDTSDL